MSSDRDSSADSFEASYERLESIVRQLEEGNLGLSEALKLYEEGVKRLKSCHGALEKAERKIELLTGLDANGNPITEPLEDESMSLEEKRAARSERRTAKKRKKPVKNTDMDEPQGLF